MLKLKPAGMILGCLMGSWLVASPAVNDVAVAAERPRNPWVTEIGEARDITYTAKQISDRLRDKYPFCPATAPAMRLEQSTSQLKSLVEDGANLRAIEMLSRNIRTMSTQVHRLIAEDRHVRSDSRLLSLTGELNRRLDRFDSEIEKSTNRTVNRPNYDSHVGRTHRGTSHFGDTYVRRPNVHSAPDWHNPFPVSRHRDDFTYRSPDTYRSPSTVPPPVVIPVHPIHNPHTPHRDPPSPTGRVLSKILTHVFDL